MSQAKVQDYLKKNGPATSKEIAEDLEIAISTIRENLKRMTDYNEVRRRWVHKDGYRTYLYVLTPDRRKKVAPLKLQHGKSKTDLERLKE